MSEPLDLRSLADVDEPDVVKEALRTFRRRALTRYVWLVIAGLVIVGWILWGRAHTDLASRVGSANAWAANLVVERRPGYTAEVTKVADLGNTLGIEVSVIAMPVNRPGGNDVWMQATTSSPGQVSSQGARELTQYLEVPKPSDGMVQVDVSLSWGGCSSPPACPPSPVDGGSFTIDLRALHVPGSIWRPGGAG